MFMSSIKTSLFTKRHSLSRASESSQPESLDQTDFNNYPAQPEESALFSVTHEQPFLETSVSRNHEELNLALAQNDLESVKREIHKGGRC